MEAKGDGLKRISCSAITLDVFTSQSRVANRLLSLLRAALITDYPSRFHPQKWNSPFQSHKFELF